MEADRQKYESEKAEFLSSVEALTRKVNEQGRTIEAPLNRKPELQGKKSAGKAYYRGPESSF
jgi:hypothetical protein